MITNAISAIVLAILLYGRSLWKTNRSLHAKIMMGVILTDISLVVYLSVFNNALTKINATMSGLLMIHIFFALSTVIGYLFAIYYGLGLYLGNPPPEKTLHFRKQIRRVDRIVVPMRVMTLVTSIGVYLQHH